MSDGLTCIFNMSLTGSAVMILVMLLRVCMRQVPKRMICLLWLVPFIRLLLPVSIEAPFSLLPVNPHSFTEITVAERNVPVVSTGIEAIDIPVNLVLISRYTSQTPGEAEEVYTLYGGVEMVWAAGMLLFLTVNAVRYYNMKQRLADSVPGADGAYYSDLLTVPLVAGVLPPRVYLPAALLKDGNEKEREFVLAHERAHIARHDPFTKILAFSALSIHWFNPLVWLMYFLFNRDMELLCDEAVVRKKRESRRDYALALLSMAQRKSLGFQTGLGFGKNAVTERITAVMKVKQMTWKGILGAGAALVIALTVFGSHYVSYASEAQTLETFELAEYTVTADVVQEQEFSYEAAEAEAVLGTAREVGDTAETAEAAEYVTATYSVSAEAADEEGLVEEASQVSEDTLKSIEEVIGEYREFGLTMRTGRGDYQLYYEEEPVCFFADNTIPEEEGFSGRLFMRPAGRRNGRTGVITQRDQNGEITGLKHLTEEESEAYTGRWK